MGVGKLEDIVKRNKGANRPKERVAVGMVVGLFIIVIIIVAGFTDLGKPPTDDVGPPAPPALTPNQPREKRMHVPLGGGSRPAKQPQHAADGSNR